MNALSRFRVHGLRARLVLLVVIALTPAIGLVLLLAYQEHRVALADIRNQIQHLAGAMLLDQERQVGRAAEMLAAVAKAEEVRQEPTDRCDRYLRTVLAQNPIYTILAVADPSGRIRCSTLPFPAGITIANQAYAQRVLATRAFAVGVYQVGHISHKASLSFGYPLLDAAGAVNGILFGGLDLRRIGDLFDKARLPKGGVAVIIDGEGTVLARYPEPEKWIGRAFPDAPLYRAMRANRAGGVVDLPGLDGVDSLFAYAPLLEGRAGDVFIAVGVPAATAHAAARDRITWLFAALAIASALVLAAAWIFGRLLVTKRIESLVASARRLADGDLAARAGLGDDRTELGELGRAFDEMAQTLQTRQHEVESQRAVLERAQSALREANDQLEQRIARRTSELLRTQQELVADIDERARAERELQSSNSEFQQINQKLKEMQSQLFQSEKMASVGQLAAGVAHEINNPIGYVYSNLGTLGGYLKDLLAMLDTYAEAESALPAGGPDLQKIQSRKQQLDLAFMREDVGMLMAESREGITRVRKIVQDLKDFSHADGKDEWQIVDLFKGLDSTLNIANNEIKYKAQVIRELAPLPEIECLPAQLNQVFLNLLVNAAHAIADKGTITLRSGSAGEEVWIEVADTGCGIPAEIVKRIFDPFFTTKPIGKGTGLGLSLAYGIVKKHHGRIEVTSEPGRGTTFRVTLPVRQAHPAEALAA